MASSASALARDASAAALRPFAAGAILLAVAMSVGRFAYTPLLVVMRADAGLTVPAAGLLASANLAGYLIGALAAMLPAVRVRRKLAVTISALGVAALTIAMAGPAWVWLAARLVTGIFSGLVFVLSVSAMLDLAKVSGSRWGLALFFSGVGSGIALVGAVVPVLARANGSHGAWVALGAASAVAAAVAVRWLPADRASATGVSAAEPASAGDGGFWWLAVLYGVEGAVYIIPATFLVALVAETPGLAAFAQYTWVAVGLAAAPSVAVWTAVASRAGVATALLCACLAQGLALIVPAFAGGAAGALVLAFGLGATFMGITALGTSLGRSYRPARSTAAIGLLTVLYGIGQIIGPLVATQIALVTGSYRAAMPVAASALLLPAVAFGVRLAAVRRRPRTA
ncbi:MAG TPA: YbfB/YjiJ family MFS transporter [Candidatus Elarobacter sp.]|jgi:predicted MFS family arabinose efflux permease